MREFHRQVMDWLRENGAQDIRLVQTNNHPRVVFDWQGRERFYVVPGTPGDSRCAVHNSLRDLRRMLGLTPTEKRVGERRRHKERNRVDLPELPAITPGKNWQAALLSHRTVDLNARLDAAFLRLWRHCMKGESRI